MMEKTWLIRTKNNHILGPVSLQKVKELLEKGSIKGDDELCSGDGYWFFVREKELVDRYIVMGQKQGFNPVSEADSVLCKGQNDLSSDQGVDITSLPNEADLEYPDMDDDISLPSDADLDYPEPQVDELEKQEDTLKQLRNKAQGQEKKKITPKPSQPKKKVQASQGSVPQLTSIKKASRSQNVLLFVGGFFFVLALVAVYYRMTLLKVFMNTQISVFSPAYAQVIPEAVKKK